MNARVVERICKVLLVCEVFPLLANKNKNLGEKSINLRGTGSCTNAKLIKSCRITRITKA